MVSYFTLNIRWQGLALATLALATLARVARDKDFVIADVIRNR